MNKQIHVIAQLKNGEEIKGVTYGDIAAGEWHAIFTQDSGLNFHYGKVLWVLPTHRQPYEVVAREAHNESI